MQPAKALKEVISLSELSGVPEPRSLEEVVPNTGRLIEFMHSGERRLSGEPFANHPKRVKMLVDGVLKETKYKIAGQASSLCHDLGEIGVMILDGFSRNYIEDPRSLNYFYRKTGTTGKGICYIDVKMTTNEPGISYIVQMQASILRINTAPGSRRPYDIITVIEKACDMVDNTNPEEAVDEDHYIAVYREHAGKGTVHELKNIHGLTQYLKDGEEISSEEDFIRILKEKLENKLLGKAFDSIAPGIEPRNNYPYLPPIKRLLNDTNKKDRELFYVDKMTDIIDRWELNSRIIIDRYGKDGRLDLLQSTGYFKGL